MSEDLRGRLFIVGLVFLAALVWTLPNFMDTSKIWWPTQNKLSYGLDIQGGLNLVLAVDVDSAMERRIQKMIPTIKKDLEEKKGVKGVEIEILNPSQGHIKVVFSNNKNKKAILDYFKDESYGQGRTFQTLTVTDRFLESRFYQVQLKNFKKSLVDRTIETIRNRIDEFGVKEPTIVAQSEERILVQLPGLENSAQAKELINKTAQLNFMIVDPKYAPGTEGFEELTLWVDEEEKKGSLSLSKLSYSGYVKKMNQALKNRFPKNRILRFSKAENAKNLQAGKVPYLLDTTSMMSGDSLNDAYVDLDSLGQPVVLFAFDSKGAKEFGLLTQNNVKKQLAIVLDEVVQQAPNLTEAITGGRGEIRMGSLGDRDKTMEEAKLLSMVLRSGALPAQLTELEERTVGPSLGKDSIEKGKWAGWIGAVLVFIFMLLYYKFYGALANVALAFNVLLVLGVLTGLQATLTLPGVAGIVLTIGMAVDANVIIFERIKEELKKGVGLVGAIHEGYNRAFWAIFDANVTTGAVCLVLMYFGSGPIRGFAVTLACGILASMFTAIFFTRTLLNLFVGRWKWKWVP